MKYQFSTCISTAFVRTKRLARLSSVGLRPLSVLSPKNQKTLQFLLQKCQKKTQSFCSKKLFSLHFSRKCRENLNLTNVGATAMLESSILNICSDWVKGRRHTPQEPLSHHKVLSALCPCPSMDSPTLKDVKGSFVSEGKRTKGTFNLGANSTISDRLGKYENFLWV